MSAGRRVFLQFLLLAGAIVALLLVLGWVPTRRLAGDAGPPAMIAGCLVSLLASLAGTVPVLLARRRSHVEMVPAALGATATRLGVVVVAAAAVALSGVVETKPLLLWVVISHGGLLIADTLLSVRVLSKRELAKSALAER